MKFDCIAWVAADKHGNVDSGVCQESSDTIQVSGLWEETNREPLYFEAELYHLESFAREHGLDVVIRHHEFEIDMNPGESNGGA